MYKKCLEMAGVDVLAFESFGSYQGDWWAKVFDGDKTGWIHGYFGSCSGCDAFEAEFGDVPSHYHGGEYISYYDMLERGAYNCPHCRELVSRMTRFGEEYLDGMMTQEEAEATASEHISWDLDAKDMLDFIKENK